jgi:outer membrane lipoprotein SlyB
MQRTIKVVILMVLFGFVALPVMAQDLYVFPKNGQSNEKMEKDKYACYEWSKKQTGFDPMQQPTASSPPPPQQQSSASAGRGAAGGALAGLAIGSLSGNAGRGAAIGAVSGGLIGGTRRHSQQRQQQQAEQEWAQQQASEYQHRRNEYNRAYGACLEGKGYTVK